MALDRNQLALRASRELRDGYYVNLGIGIPTLVANHVPAGMTVWLQSENGLLGMGPFPKDSEVDADLVNAGQYARVLHQRNPRPPSDRHHRHVAVNQNRRGSLGLHLVHADSWCGLNQPEQPSLAVKLECRKIRNQHVHAMLPSEGQGACRDELALALLVAVVHDHHHAPHASH